MKEGKREDFFSKDGEGVSIISRDFMRQNSPKVISDPRMRKGAKARRPLPGAFLIPPVLQVVADQIRFLPAVEMTFPTNPTFCETINVLKIKKKESILFSG